MTSSLLRNKVAIRRGIRSAFTMIEMLVAITIMLIVFSLTAGVVTLAINTDRIPSSARSVQAAILGARDRAVRAGRADLNQQPMRGVRLVPNPNIPNTVNSLLYIGNQDDWTDGTVNVVSGSTAITGSTWTQLTDIDIKNARIKIPNSSTGLWYRLNSPADPLPDPPFVLPTDLTRVYTGSTNSSESFRLRLPPSVLPNEQPIQLDGNVLIDLNRSEVPSGWSGEILFTPEGKVSGPLSAQGAIYLYLCSVDDVLNGYGPADVKSGDKLAIKINLQTGQIQSFPISPTGDPFKFAKQ